MMGATKKNSKHQRFVEISEVTITCILNYV